MSQSMKSWISSWFSSGKKLPSSLITKQANKGRFRITINERGFLDSQNNATLTCEVPGSTTIISIVPEGAAVKQGDIVCELDSSSLEEKARQAEIDVTKAEASFSAARENLEIQKTQNASDIAFAQLSLELAELDYNKFMEGELPQQRDQILGQIRLKQEELARKEEAYEFTKRMAKKGYRSPSELEAQRIAMTQAEIQLRVEEENMRVLDKFTAPRTIRELEANAKELVRELDRVKRQAAAALAKAEAEFESSKLTLEVEKQKYDDWLKHIELCTLRAPQDGQIVYANSSSGRRGGSGEPDIIEGATVRERQAIVKIPDLTKMKIDARIHESMISQLDLGQPVIIRADAQPGEVYHGVVATISSVPLSGSFPNYDIKEYQVAINLTDPPERVRMLRPGLSAEFEVVVEDREDVLQVPVQAVVQVGKDYYMWVVSGQKSIQRRQVKVGKSNQTDIEILDGVKPGDSVVMSPRTIFSDEITDLEEILTAKLAAEKLSAGEEAADAVDGMREESPKPRKPNSGGKPDGQKAGGDPSAFFSRLDKDGNGLISKEEAPPQLQNAFSTADSDGDGSLSPAELKAHAANRPQ